jgi:hypothetical protein
VALTDEEVEIRVVRLLDGVMSATPETESRVGVPKS